MSGTILLWLLPWIGVIAYVVIVVRDPPELPPARPLRPHDAPSVSVIVPARDEAHNIGHCVGSLIASDYPDFEVIVVDDRSLDRTGAAARAAGSGFARRLLVIHGAELPEGWFGKQWACWQGYRAARGELLLFTDADTVHESSLLARSVAGLAAERADCLTVIGRQIMGSFWERLVQPHVFLLLAVRYPRMGERPLPRRRWRSAIANGQYLLFERGAYERLGGHAAVRYEAAEDLRLAQRLVQGGGRLVIRRSYEGLGTRMYRGLGEVVAGWSKNMIPAGLQTVHPLLRRVTPLAMLLSGVGAWLLPPAALIAALLGAGGAALRPELLLWAGATTGLLVLFWAGVSRRFGAPAWMGLLYPVGAAVAHWILIKSWLGRRRVRWKGRSYAWDVYSDARAETPPRAPGTDPG
jgi:chlorobactene glucosyltransferase